MHKLIKRLGNPLVEALAGDGHRTRAHSAKGPDQDNRLMSLAIFVKMGPF